LIKKSRFPRVFFGWWTVIAGGIITFWGMGFGTFGFTALFKPIASELGFNRAVTSVAASVGRAEGGFISPVVGLVIDKFGPKWLVFFGVLGMGASLVLMYFINSLWAFYLVWGVLLGIASNVGFMLPLDKTIADWFVKKRGRALSIKFMFTGFAAVLMVPLIAWLISTQGWRMTCVIGGVVMWIIGLPLAWFFIKQHRPEHYGMLPDGAATNETLEISQMIDRGVKYATEVEEREFTLRQAMRTPAYWLLILSSASWGLVGPTFVIHGIPFLTDMGFEPVRAAVVMGMMSAGVIPGALLAASVADRFKKERLRFIVVGASVLQLAGISVFILNPTQAMVFPLFISHHFGAGLMSPILGTISARYFGRKAFGSIRGTLTMFILPFSVGAPIFAGWIYDTTGSYMIVFIVCAVLLILGLIALCLAFPPKPPAQVTDVYKIV
jgi:sugar phosphate permease